MGEEKRRGRNVPMKPTVHQAVTNAVAWVKANVDESYTVSDLIEAGALTEAERLRSEFHGQLAGREFPESDGVPIGKPPHTDGAWDSVLRPHQ